LQVTASVIKKVYEKGKKVAEDFKQTMRIKFDRNLGRWNYRVSPIGG
jgi:hypothetical protein